MWAGQRPTRFGGRVCVFAPEKGKRAEKQEALPVEGRAVHVHAACMQETLLRGDATRRLRLWLRLRPRDTGDRRVPDRRYSGRSARERCGSLRRSARRQTRRQCYVSSFFFFFFSLFPFPISFFGPSEKKNFFVGPPPPRARICQFNVGVSLYSGRLVAPQYGAREQDRCAHFSERRQTRPGRRTGKTGTDRWRDPESPANRPTG